MTTQTSRHFFILFKNLIGVDPTVTQYQAIFYLSWNPRIKFRSTSNFSLSCPI